MTGRKSSSVTHPVSASGTDAPTTERTRDTLIEVATRLFAAKGFDGTTVKDISEAAGANVSLISYYFQGKEGLYRACLEKFGNDRLSIAQRLLTGPTSTEDMRVRLQMLVEEMLQCYVAQPELVALIHRECETGLPVAMDVFKGTFLQVFRTLVTFIETAVARGIMKRDIDPQTVAAIFFGSLTNFSRSDRIGERLLNLTIRDERYRDSVKRHFLPIFMDGLIDRAQSGSSNFHTDSQDHSTGQANGGER